MLPFVKILWLSSNEVSEVSEDHFYTIRDNIGLFTCAQKRNKSQQSARYTKRKKYLKNGLLRRNNPSNTVHREEVKLQEEFVTFNSIGLGLLQWGRELSQTTIRLSTGGSIAAFPG